MEKMNKAPQTRESRRSSFSPEAKWFQLRPWRAVLALSLDWLILLSSFVVSIIWPYWFVVLPAALIVARTQLALAVMMHESAHGLLLPKQRWNDIVGQFFAAGPLLLSMKTYRAGHLKHHKNPMAPDDPVAAIFQITDYPTSRPQLVVRLLTDLSGIGFFLNLKHIRTSAIKNILPAVNKSRVWKIIEILSMLLPHLFLLGGLNYLGVAWLYFWLWLLPSITLLPFMGRVRAIMEHAGLPAGVCQSLNARSIVRPSWQTFFFGPHAIHYHIEHHLFPRMPFYHLRALHSAMVTKGLLTHENLYTSYLKVLGDLSIDSSKKGS